MPGLHHVTAIAGNALRNLDFYTRTVGLRLVKRTVNFDDPGTYHLYYGDESGHPGTVLTFFPWEHAVKGRLGTGETQETAFRVPARALGYWTQRFVERGVTHETPEKRFGETVLPFSDPDGMSLALVGVPEAEAENQPGWSNGAIPAEHAIRGFHGVTFGLADGARTGAILTDVLGFKEAEREGAIVRYRAARAGPGAVVDIRRSGGERGRQGRGSVHHIAFRAADDAEQAAMAQKLVTQRRVHPTDQRDRNYFRSIYFREPGGVLFEIATDIPGFAVDEPVAALGSALKLPPFLEPRRREIEKALPALETVA
jgi:glyoxalase family protein